MKIRPVFKKQSRHICLILLAFIAILLQNITPSSSFAALEEEDANVFSANDITFYDPSECAKDDCDDTLSASGDFSKISSAKNADKNVFNVDKNSEWGANWSDNDKSRLKHVLETYGELAYQLGQAVGSPWEAIFVQMRYEDSGSKCGANNFWGNGCPKGTPVGGSSIKANNLGEGFTQYGKTLTKICSNAANVSDTNECQKSLQTSDPEEYLDRVGPLWVQGDANGSGYGTIDSMKKSLKALKSYLNSSEGQAVLKTIAKDGGGGSSSCSPTGATCPKLGEDRTAMWKEASEEDKKRFMNVVVNEDESMAGVEGFMNQVLWYNYHYKVEKNLLNNWLGRQCHDFMENSNICDGSESISGDRKKWIDEALAGSNKLNFATGNATGGSSTGVGKIACVWDGKKCRTDVDYTKEDGKGDCAVYSPSESFGECWGYDSNPDSVEKWIEEKYSNCSSGSSSTTSGFSSTTSGSSNDSSGAKWKDGWLVEGSLTGAEKEDVNGKTLSESAYKTGDYSTNGKPNKILLHYTEGTTGGFAAYPSGNVFPAHFTIDVKKKKIIQAFSIYQPALAIKTYDKSAGVQIEIVGFGHEKPDSEYTLSKFSDEEWDYIASLLVAISKETGIPLKSSVKWAGTPPRLSPAAFSAYEGVLGHMHAPNNDHDDPGDIWKFLEPAIKRVQGESCNSYEGDYPQYFQSDYDRSDHAPDTHDWTNDPYSEGNIGSSGCGPSSMAMLATVASGKDIYPHDIVNITKPGNYAKSGERGFVDFDKKVGEKYGFDVEEVTFSGMDDAVKKIKEYADKGYMAHFSGQGCTISPSCGSHYVGIFEVKDDQALVADSSKRGNRWVNLADFVSSGIKKGRFTAIKKGSSTNKDTCSDLCAGAEDTSSSGNGDILSAVEEIIALANKNGSTYMSGPNRSISAFNEMLNNNKPIDLDCTGFASLALYKAFGDKFKESHIFSSASIYTNSAYKRIDRKDIQPGDIAAASDYHGVIIIEVQDGKVTKIAETGGTEGRSGSNNNIGYSGPSDYTVRDINGEGSHNYNFFRYKGE